MRNILPTTFTVLFCSIAVAACGGVEEFDDTETSEAEVREREREEERRVEASRRAEEEERRRREEEERRRGEEEERTRCLSRIPCRVDESCPRGSYCETGLNYCFTSSRCYVNGRPSDRFCRAEYGENFLCVEYATDSHHCVPVEVTVCER
jgi:hypothetical protein